MYLHPVAMYKVQVFKYDFNLPFYVNYYRYYHIIHTTCKSTKFSRQSGVPLVLRSSYLAANERNSELILVTKQLTIIFRCIQKEIPRYNKFYSIKRQHDLLFTAALNVQYVKDYKLRITSTMFILGLRLLGMWCELGL